MILTPAMNILLLSYILDNRRKSYISFVGRIAKQSLIYDMTMFVPLIQASMIGFTISLAYSTSVVIILLMIVIRPFGQRKVTTSNFIG